MTEARLERAGAPALHYWSEGSGPPLMLIHGVGADGTSWDRIAAALTPRFRVLRLDLRGHGRSGLIPPEDAAALSLADFARDVLDVMAACGVAKAHIAGFSLGGLIAQLIALDNPEAVDRLVLLSAVAGRNEQERARVRERLETLRTQGVSAITGANQERWFTPGFIAANPEIVARRMQQLKENDPVSYAASYTVFSTSDLAERLHAIKHRTLIATGENDQGSNHRMARFMAERIEGSRLEILLVLRHSILMEAPDVVTRLLLEFLC